MTDPRPDVEGIERGRYERAAKIMLEEAGLEFCAPWEGDLDDEERGRFEALSAVLAVPPAVTDEMVERAKRSLLHDGYAVSAIKVSRALLAALGGENGNG